MSVFLIALVVSLATFGFVCWLWRRHRGGTVGWGYSSFMRGTYIGTALITLVLLVALFANESKTVWPRVFLFAPLAIPVIWLVSWVPFGPLGLLCAYIVRKARTRSTAVLGCDEHGLEAKSVLTAPVKQPTFNSRAELCAILLMSSIGIAACAMALYTFRSEYEAYTHPDPFLAD